MKKLYERKWLGNDEVYTIAEVTDGVVCDARVVQIGGNFRSSGGAEGEVMGKTEQQIIAEGFRLRPPPVPE